MWKDGRPWQKIRVVSFRGKEWSIDPCPKEMQVATGDWTWEGSRLLALDWDPRECSWPPLRLDHAPLESFDTMHVLAHKI